MFSEGIVPCSLFNKKVLELRFFDQWSIKQLKFPGCSSVGEIYPKGDA